MMRTGDMVSGHMVIWGLPRGQRLLPKMLLCVLCCVITMIVQARPILLVRKTITFTQNIHGAPGDRWLQLDVTGWLQISSSHSWWLSLDIVTMSRWHNVTKHLTLGPGMMSNYVTTLPFNKHYRHINSYFQDKFGELFGVSLKRFATLMCLWVILSSHRRWQWPQMTMRWHNSEYKPTSSS